MGNVLYRTSLLEVRLDVAGDHHHRNGVRHRGGNTDQRVNGSRSHGRGHHNWLTGDTKVSICQVGGRLFVADHQHWQFVRPSSDRINERQVPVTGDAHHEWDLSTNQVVN